MTERASPPPGEEVFAPMATFSGLKGVPLVALSRNSLFPALTLGDRALTIRVIRRHVLRYDDLATVRHARRLATQIIFVPKQGIRTFSANFPDADSARRLLHRLSDAGVPLDSSALTFLTASGRP